MRKIRLSELVEDFDLYPRGAVDGQNVGYIAEAIAAGVTMPPILIDAKSKRIIDGFHRKRAYKRLSKREDCKVDVAEKTYKSEKEMVLDAMRLNANHGRTLTRFDRIHCLLLAERKGISVEEASGALSMTVDAASKLTTERVGKLRVGNAIQRTPLKRTARHMAGKILTKGQVEANAKLTGMNQSLYVNQLILLLENDLLDTADESLMQRLERLHELMEKQLQLA